MVEKPFQLRYLNSIAAAFLLCAVFLLALVIFLTGREQGWFEKSKVFYVDLTPKAADVIRAGADVFLLGNRIGTVKRIGFRKGKNVVPFPSVLRSDAIQPTAVLYLKGNYVRLIGQGSVATLRQSLGGFGSGFFDLTVRINSDLLVDNTIPLELEPSAKEEFAEIVKPAIAAAEQALTRIGALAAEDSELSRGVASFASVTKGLEESGVFVAQGTEAPEFRQMIEKIRAAAGSIDDVVTKRIGPAVDHIGGTAKSADSLISKDLRGALQDVRKAMADLDIDLAAAQHHWLLRSQVKQVQEERARKLAEPTPRPRR